MCHSSGGEEEQGMWGYAAATDSFASYASDAPSGIRLDQIGKINDVASWLVNGIIVFERVG